MVPFPKHVPRYDLRSYDYAVILHQFNIPSLFCAASLLHFKTIEWDAGRYLIMSSIEQCCVETKQLKRVLHSDPQNLFRDWHYNKSKAPTSLAECLK